MRQKLANLVVVRKFPELVIKGLMKTNYECSAFKSLMRYLRLRFFSLNF